MFDNNGNNITIHPDMAYHVSRLSFGGIEIIMPQTEIVSIESVYELERDKENKKYLGLIYKQGVKVPVYCFSAEMKVLTYLPEDRFQCVVIRSETGDFAVLCNEIKNVVLSDIRFEPIPKCMENASVPLTHLCLYKENENGMKVGLVTNAACLNEYINL